MAEYINKDEALNFIKGIEALHHNDVLRINLLNGINVISSTADVIERSEYEKLRLVNLDLAETNKGLLAEHEQLEKLRSKIDKAIEEMNNIELGLVMDCDEMRDYCVEILKRNIGE